MTETLRCLKRVSVIDGGACLLAEGHQGPCKDADAICKERKGWSGFGCWPQHANINVPTCHGDPLTTHIGAGLLSYLGVVEDWGCGLCYFSLTMAYANPLCKVVGVDGSPSKFVSKLVDLKDYTSDVPGIFMRGVLEHNWCWRQILTNACKSFQKRFVLVLFTPFQHETHDLYIEKFGRNHEYVGLGFDIHDLIRVFDDCECSWTMKGFKTDTEWGMEHVFDIRHKGIHRL